MQGSRKRERHDDFSSPFPLSEIPECSLPDAEAEPFEPRHGLSQDGVSLFGVAKRTKQNGFLASYCVDHTPAHASHVASNDSLLFSFEAPISSSCHGGILPTCMNVGANGYTAAMHVESTQSMCSAVAPHNHADQSLHNFATTADACAVVFEKVRIDPIEASRFQKDHAHTKDCKPSGLSRGSVATDPEWLSSSEASPTSYSS